MRKEITLDINGRSEVVTVDPGTPLLMVLRNDLGLTAAKFGCGLEQCFACAVLVDGEATATCAAAVEQFAGRRIVTLEGLAPGAGLHPRIRLWIWRHGLPQSMRAFSALHRPS